MNGQNNQMGRLLVIEPNLRNPSGHYAEFVRALGMRADGMAIDVFAHPDADELLASMPAVSPCMDEPRVGRACAEWRTIMRATREGIPFLVLTSDGRHGAVVSLAAALSGRTPDHACLYFHWIPTGLQDAVLHRLSAPAREHALAIVPTEAIARTLREMGWRRVACLPYPAIGPEHLPEPAPFARLLMAGAARMNKGLDLIAGLANNWAREGRAIPLFVQVSTKHAARHGRREVDVVRSLLSSGYSGLVTDDHPPDREGYTARFRGALVLAPYERERFADAVSGVVLDALLHGTPVIATRGTWPGVQVERFGAGVTIEERTPEALAAAIDRVLGDWETYAARACDAARVLAGEHDPRRILELVTA
ncbi:glycosyltransferase [Geomobilimonas luticola]|nr:glycosyltransferase [Geomobilimonas luticola]